MTEIELIIDLHKNNERQGPGSEKDTLRALGFIDLAQKSKVKLADLGCGSGGQTITLAQNTSGLITAVDLFPEFLVELEEKSNKLGFDKRINTLQASIDNLPFESGEFDIIWSEGAIYNMGFEKGIQNWKKFLKHGGYLALSEITWTTNSRPEEIESFWTSDYPEVDTASNKIGVLENFGFSPVGYFTLSQKSWIDSYYKPLETKFETFLERHGNSELARKVVGDCRSEINLYMKYKDYFSYGFYIAKKTI